MPESSLSIRSENYPYKQFRTTPWFIIRDSSIKSNGMALVLSVIWAAIQSSGIHKSTCKIKNEEIAKRSGIRGGSEEVRRYLALAEQFGYIKRHGNHKNRTIEFLLSPPQDGDCDGLIIDQDIIDSNYSPTEKLLIAIKRGFSKAGPDWICNQLGISKWTYWTKINSITKTNPKILSLEPPEKAKLNPLKKQSEPPEKANALGGIERVERGVELLSKDINGRAAPANYRFGGNEMIQHPENFGEEYSGLVSQSTRNKKSPIASAEIDHCFNTLPNNTRHKCGTRAYEDARRTIRALIMSPRKVLKAGEINILTKTMTSKFTANQVREFLDHKFTISERLEIYKRLSNYYDKSYRPKATGKANLASALYNPYADGFSLIMKVWFDKPQPIRYPILEINQELKKIVNTVLELIEDNDRATRARLTKNINSINRYYLKVLKPRMNSEALYHYGDFKSYMEAYIDWALDRQNARFKINAGWFSPGSKIHQEWEKVMLDWTSISEPDMVEAFRSWEAEL